MRKSKSDDSKDGYASILGDPVVDTFHKNISFKLDR